MDQNLDSYNREITYLGVSVTDRCNLRCIYCGPVKDLKLVDHADILNNEGPAERYRFESAEGEIGFGCSQEDLRRLFQQAIARKPRRHHAEALEKGESIPPMSTIGG